MTDRHILIGGILREAARYLIASPHSRLHQLEALRELDDRLLADIGVTWRQALRSQPFHRRHPRGRHIKRPLKEAS